MALFMANCTNKPSHTLEVKTLDSLLAEVDAVEVVFNKLPHEGVNTRLDSIQSTIKFVEANYGGEISKENGFLLDNYRSTKSIVKRFGERTSQIQKEVARTKSQLSNFKEALSSGATHDKNNEKIDSKYIEKNMSLEKEAAGTLISGVNELKERSERFITKNEEKLQELLPYLNSLK